ncbi:6812_t:CDS:2 [Funneliformis caledonium]|uniref:Pre-mRNA-splicing factor SYF2 n=1 Tax=Funneliformis caledonium TaxID=1117310 RepID=A0A9N9ALI8_9GLOM|nr:6812_t:CDS:2 [Funneliformis caledonium]
MPPKKKNTASKSNQIQPESNVEDATSATAPSQEEPPPKKKATRKPRTTKKKDLVSQEGSTSIIEPNSSTTISADTQLQEATIPVKKKPGRKSKAKQQEVVTVKEEPLEQQQQQFITTTAPSTVPQQHLLFINATPEEPVKKKPGRKPKVKKQEADQQNQQPPPEKNINSFPPHGFKSGIQSESQNSNNYNTSPPVASSPDVQPAIAPIPTPLPAATHSKRGRPKKVKSLEADPQAVSAETKVAPTRKRKSKKQEASAELNQVSDIVANSSSQEQISSQHRHEEEVDQLAKAANPPKKRRTKKQDAAVVSTSQMESASGQVPEQYEQQPPAKATKRGRPKKTKPDSTGVEKLSNNEEAVIKMEDLVPSPVIESHVTESQIKVEPSEKTSTGPKNSSVVLNEYENSEQQERKNLSDSINPHSIDRGDVKIFDASENSYDIHQVQELQVQEQDVTMEDTHNKDLTVNNEQSIKRKRSIDNNDIEDEINVQNKSSQIEEVRARMEKFKKLRSRMDEGETANRKEVFEEHQRKKTNPKEIIKQERKREEAEKLLAKQQAEERGEDYERSKFWEYSAESVEKWEKKQEKKAKKSDVAFTDYNQVAHKKYKRQINELKPDLVTYKEQKAAAVASSSLVTTEDGQIVSVDTESNFYRDANSLQYASVDNQPTREAIDRVVADVNKTIAKREKSSRQKPVNEDDDITYINERNRRFNEKIGRFYDKYTKEIKENFERGTA